VITTVRQRVEAQAAGLVGRETERAVLHQLLADDGPLVAFVHGIGGVGKTALVETFAGDARAAGAVVVQFDCGTIEPTERGFLAVLASAVGGDFETATDAGARLVGLGDRVVIILDRYELFRPLDPWLQQTFVPALSDTVRLLAAGREPPMAGWALGLRSLFRSLALDNLPAKDAERLLRREGVDGDDVARINRLARGHPLSLRLAAAALEAGPSLDHGTTTITALVGELTELYLARLDSGTRQALDAASVVRRPTLSLVGAMLPDAAPQDAFNRLRQLPFVQLSDDGLVLHDTVREVVAAHLRSTDPDRSRRYRIAAWRQLRDEVARATPHEMWRYTADLLYILENPMIREAFFPTTQHLYVVDAAQPADGPAIEEIATRHEPPAVVALLGLWWRLLPTAFRVARDSAGTIVAFYVVTEMDRIPRGILEADPVTRRCRDDLRQKPVARGERVLLDRVELARDLDETYPLVSAALVLDVKRTYMELRPALRRVYFVDRELVTPGSTWSQVGFEALPGDAPKLDGIAYYPAVLDMGPASVDGWLARLVAAELQLNDDAILDVSQHQLVIDGRRVDLTRLEFEVVNYLYERRGKVVDRPSLLRDVWGYDYAGGSNVIDVLVGSIRRKLGERAAAIETVRGLGYRFVATA
jgi:hypothetical protein